MIFRMIKNLENNCESFKTGVVKDIRTDSGAIARMNCVKLWDWVIGLNRFLLVVWTHEMDPDYGLELNNGILIWQFVWGPWAWLYFRT